MPVRADCCETGGGSSVVDKFAPKYLVGNELAGDTAASASASGFVYFQDPGDGTGILAALAAAGVTPGDVWVRPGTYTLDQRLVVPAGVLMRGAGMGLTIIENGNGADECVIVLRTASGLRDLTAHSVGGGGIAGSALLLAPATASDLPIALNRVDVLVDGDVSVSPIISQGGPLVLDQCVLRRNGGAGVVIGLSLDGVAGNPASVQMTSCRLLNLGTALNPMVRMGVIGATSIRDCQFVGNTLVGPAGAVPFELGAQCTNSLFGFNVSRGTGGTLPTDAGVGNSFSNNLWGA